MAPLEELGYMQFIKGNHPARWVVPLIIIVLSALAFWQSTQFDRVPPILKRGMQPEDFPQIIIALIIFLAVLLLIKDTDQAPEKMTGKVWPSMALMIAFALVIEIDLFLGLGVFSFLLCLLWGEKRVKALLLVGIVVPLIVFFFFDQVFEIRFPKGILTNLWYG